PARHSSDLTAAVTGGTPCNPEITVTATDSCGNTTTKKCTAHVDGTAPTLTVDCAALAACHADNAAAIADVLGHSSASDNCDASIAPTAAVTGGTPCNPEITVTATDSCGNSTTKKCTAHVDRTAPTATHGTILACYPDAASANQAALDATTGLTDNCGATGVTKAVQTGAGTCDTAIVIRVQDSCGNYTDYTYTTRVDGAKPTATQGTIASCYPDGTSANNAALAATTALTDNCGATGVTKSVQTGAGTCDTAIVIRVQASCG